VSVFGVSVFGVSVFGVSVFGVSVFGVSVFGVSVFGVSVVVCLLALLGWILVILGTLYPGVTFGDVLFLGCL